MSGFKVLGEVMIAILPFWPLFLIAGLIFYFVQRSKKKKEVQSLENPTNIPVQKTDAITPAENIEKENDEDSDETDYSKYLPKE